MHPFSEWFWNRSPVYQAFGFDRFLSEEHMPPLAKRGPLASDAGVDRRDHPPGRSDAESRSSSSPSRCRATDPTSPTATSTPTHKVDAPVERMGQESILTYAEGAADADRGLQRLMDWASKRERKTIIAFFGDHLPPLGPVYVETGFMKEPVASARRRSPRCTAEHETPLVIWSNRGGHGQGHRRDQPGLHPAAGAEDRRHHAIPTTPGSSARSTTASGWSTATC